MRGRVSNTQHENLQVVRAREWFLDGYDAMPISTEPPKLRAEGSGQMDRYKLKCRAL